MLWVLCRLSGCRTCPCRAQAPSSLVASGTATASSLPTACAGESLCMPSFMWSRMACLCTCCQHPALSGRVRPSNGQVYLINNIAQARAGSTTATLWRFVALHDVTQSPTVLCQYLPATTSEFESLQCVPATCPHMYVRLGLFLLPRCPACTQSLAGMAINGSPPPQWLVAGTASMPLRAKLPRRHQLASLHA